MNLRKFTLPILAIFVIAGAVQAQSKPTTIVRAQGYISKSGLTPGADFTLAVVLNIAPGYHIGAADKAALWPAKMEASPVAGVALDSPDFPKPLMKSFSFSPDERLPVYEGKTVILMDGRVAKNAALGNRIIKARFSYQGCDDGQCFRPETIDISIPTKVVARGTKIAPINRELFGLSGGTTQANAAGSVFSRGMLLGLLAVFWIGVGLSFTPCVYPMIPVTVGYFGSQTGRRTRRLMLLAGLYVLGLAITYSTMGVIAARTGKALGSALQSPYVPLVIAVVLIALALSCFGLYEFRVPSAIASKTQDKRGPLGALLMGLLFGLVCAPCVGPFTVALLVYVGKIGSPLLGFVTFFALAVGMGVPFFILATFSGSINKLPRAGLWMVTVKKVFGLLLIGAAIYYLTPLIERWISVRAAELALPAFIVMSGTYLALFEKSLHTHKLSKMLKHTTGFGAIALAAWMAWPVLLPSRAAEPLSFRAYTERAVVEAKQSHKPVIIDFSASWCGACREIDDKTFPDAQVKEEGKRFVTLRADQSDVSSADAKARQQKYNIKGLPTIVFIDSKGIEQKSARVVGFIKPNELIRTMRIVK